MTTGSDRVAVVLGTRPEIIKMAEIIQVLGPRARVIHTGQHWDHALSGQFLESMQIPRPDVELGIGGASRGAQIGEALTALEAIFTRDRPRAVMVQGDTNSVVAGALAANAAGVPLVHVEAGLRSHDRAMPEEHNRVVTDHLADLCLAPTEVSRANLLAEGIDPHRVAVTGNTIVGVVERVLADLARSPTPIETGLDLADGEYVVATVHRPENTDDPEALTAILRSLAALPVPVIVPLHPRTATRARDLGLQHLVDALMVVEPMGYEAFVKAASRAALVVSDSGGIQEEASVWKRPVLVVRRSTERPEVLGTFTHLVPAGAGLVDRALDLLARRDEVFGELAALPSPYGDGHAAERCVQAMDDYLATDR